MPPRPLQSYFRLAHTVGVDLLQSLDGLVAGGCEPEREESSRGKE